MSYEELDECYAADLEPLRGVGLAREKAWDVIEIVAMYNFINRMAAATGMLPNREYYALMR
jgi:alkylhydroperoxidase family enzyme